MEISVIIPCRDLEGYIKKCLNSIIRQNYDKGKYEVLVIFDSCQDRSEEVAESCLERSGVKYRFFRTTVGRAGLARNVGLENATGKYIYFIDGDDYLIDMQAFAKLVGALQRTGCTTVYQESFESDKRVCDDEAIWRFFYTRQIIGDVRFSSAELNEDWEFVRKVKMEKGYKEVFLKDVLYHYTYPRKGSITERYRTLWEKKK